MVPAAGVQTEPTTAAPAAPAEGTPEPRAVLPTVPAASPVAEPSVETAEPVPTAGGTDELFTESVNAMAGLTTYRYVTVFSFTGEVEGKPESGSVELSGAVAGPDRQQMMWKDLSTQEQFGIIQVGGEAWMLEGDAWQPVPPTVAEMISGAILALGPAMSWGELAVDVGPSATFVGEETVNGVPARHFTSSARDWAPDWEGTLEEATNDVWIADAGYPVRYRFRASGIDAEGYKGSFLWTMELSDVNGTITIEPPQVTAEPGE